jgi:hypothetical protein
MRSITSQPAAIYGWSRVRWRGRCGPLMRSGHRGARTWSDIEWFVREGPLWRRHSERAEEVCWTAAEVERAFRAAGFADLAAIDPAPLLKAHLAPGCRTFYLARKSAAVE